MMAEVGSLRGSVCSGGPGKGALRALAPLELGQKQIFNSLHLIAVCCLVTEISALPCLEVKKEYEKTCLASTNENYVQCVKTRMKRHPDECEYDDSCYECDCELCSYSMCGGDCDECCNSCCPNFVQCHTNHCCHKQCHSECRTYLCRSSCRRACYQNIRRENIREKLTSGGTVETVILERNGQASASQDSKVNNTNVHNITTIINLKNVLNNTNLVDVPINLTYTNRNNITLHEGQVVGSNGGLGDNCCIVIGPRQCIPTPVSPFMRCFHTRSKQCGPFCSASIVHEESRQICNSVDSFGQPTNCQQQTTYIPQPQPRCTYTSTWPYVACGVQPPAECDGCYGHYFNSEVKHFQSCPPQCYDDFSAGPLYRQGPFYQPSHSHVPPCYFSPQGCPGGLGGMMGGYGMTPGGFGLFPGGYGLTQGFGGGFGYGNPIPASLPVFPFQQGINPWNTIPGLNSTSNVTDHNSTGTDFWQPQITKMYDENISSNPFPYKEVEVKVNPDDKRQQSFYKRQVRHNSKFTKD